MNSINLYQPEITRRLVYLDWNVIISMADGHFAEFRAALEEANDKDNILVLFSATHVQEADNITDQERAPEGLSGRRLRFLSELTRNTYLYNAGDQNSPSIRRQGPEDVRKILKEVPFAKELMHDIVNIFDLDQMKKNRDQLQLNPNELNNIKPPGVIAQLDQIVYRKLSALSPQLPPGFGVQQLLEMALKFYPNSSTLGIESKMAAVFSALNSLGFWPDNPKKTSSEAAFYDSMHAANAALCYYFVTEDKALRVKSLAVYEFFDIETRVVNIDEMMVKLNELPHNLSVNRNGIT